MTDLDRPASAAELWLLRSAFALMPLAWLTTQAVAIVWALICVAGALAFARCRGTPTLDEPRQRALGRLCAGAAAATALVALPVLVHHDELRFIRQELKPLLLFVAVAAWSRCRRLDPITARFMDGGLMLGMVAAPFIALTVPRDHLPGNAVPWATTVAAAVCVLMPRALLLESARLAWRLAFVASSAAALAAVALSQTRAALWVLPWLALLVVMVPRRTHTRLLLAAGLFGAAVAWGVWTQAFDPGGRLRLGDALREVERFRSQDDVETSIGARLALWGLAADRVTESPASALVGHGSAARLEAIRALAAKAASPHLAGLTHFHSQYLNSLYDFGLVGLGAVVALLLGMAGMLRGGAADDRVQRWQIGGLIWLQAAGFVTNANWLHGHYAFMISLLVAICALPRRCVHGPTARQDAGGQEPADRPVLFRPIHRG